MPKDNTHLFFSYRAMSLMEDLDLKKMIVYNIPCYYMGSIIPDTFFYSKDEGLSRISDYLHGKDGNLTNSIIFDMLDTAHDPKNLAFTMGYITHCALDITFHPLIYYLSGNYYESDPAKRQRSVYMHRYLETSLEIKLGIPALAHRLVPPPELDDLVFADIISRRFNIKRKMVRKMASRQLLFTRLFKSRLAFTVFSILVRLGIIEDTAFLGLFYYNALAKGVYFPEHVIYRDLLSGEKMETSLDDLFNKALYKVHKMMGSALAYANGLITRQECEKFIAGESLGTGKKGVPVKDIRYTIENEDQSH